MPRRDIIVVGASMGGVEALSALVSQLPADLPASLFVVLHISPGQRSYLPRILSRAGALPALHPADGESLQPGRVYVAPSDHHLLVEPERIRVVRGPKENGHRPAVDPLFRSAARAFGPRVAGVVLTGTLDCGTAGLHAIKKGGGVAIVQDPADAAYPEMPRSAMAFVRVDHSVPLASLGALLVRLATRGDGAQARPVPAPPQALEQEVEVMSISSPELVNQVPAYGQPSPFGCPDCGGVLFEMNEEGHLRFRCRVGHAYTGAALDQAQDGALEAALWTALRALEESCMLARRMARRARDNRFERSALRYEERAREAEKHVMQLRQVILGQPRPVAAAVDEEPGQQEG